MKQISNMELTGHAGGLEVGCEEERSQGWFQNFHPEQLEVAY